MFHASRKGAILIGPLLELPFTQVLKYGRTLLMEQKVMYGLWAASSIN